MSFTNFLLGFDITVTVTIEYTKNTAQYFKLSIQYCYCNQYTHQILMIISNNNHRPLQGVKHSTTLLNQHNSHKRTIHLFINDLL